MRSLKDVTVIIPAYKPSHYLISTLSSLKEQGFSDFLVVDDGGGQDYADVFKEVESMGCKVLTHEENRGKGAALKTAMRYYLSNRAFSAGIVTADADGQHLPEDIKKVALSMLESGSAVLGCRDFSDPKVPKRSVQGNRISCFMVRLNLGKKISDTQTGLRAVPRQYVDLISGVHGNRYDYEMNMLFAMIRENVPIEEETIETVYIDNNSSSHFSPVKDSIRIYRMILMFMLMSLVSTAADVLLQVFLYRAMIPHMAGVEYVLVLLAVAGCARAVSMTLNYILNYLFVFDRRGGFKSFIKYAIIGLAVFAVHCIPIILIATFASPGMFTPGKYALIKLIPAVLIFPLVFRMMHNTVFTGKSTGQND
ncbi:MAG: glycosyltransferase family 2 protein [Clostridia bacterium]|nr:glycosyltransferase family 2 protein [Clostridia bacterium]